MLFAMTREDSTIDTAALAKLIGRSQKLTLRVLSTANSAAYGLRYKVSTLHHAINILGFREVRLLVATLGFAAAIRQIRLPKTFESDALWRHHLKTATVVKTLVVELGSPSGVCGPSARQGDRLSIAPDEAYIAGLLHDIGKIFFAAIRPDLWEEIETRWKKNEQEYFEAENEYWGLDHALIAAKLLHYWKLPEVLTESINWHHMPELATTYKVEARLLAAANHIARSDFDVESGLCEEAIAFLPKGIDAAALGTAISQSLTSVQAEVFATLI